VCYVWSGSVHLVVVVVYRISECSACGDRFRLIFKCLSEAGRYYQFKHDPFRHEIVDIGKQPGHPEL
jgi:hypothetical protein